MMDPAPVRLLHCTALVAITFELSLLLPTLICLIGHYYMKEPYHTSLLSGYAWVRELLQGHPVHKNVFHALVRELQSMGHSDTRYVTLEEQLAIFLYTAVTGLSILMLGGDFSAEMGQFLSEYSIIDDNLYANQITDIVEK